MKGNLPVIVGKSTFTRETYNGGPWDDLGRVSLRQGRLTHILLCSLKTRIVFFRNSCPKLTHWSPVLCRKA